MPDWREARFTTDRDGDADAPCPVCGARSEFVYRCSECGADLCAGHGDDDKSLAPARDKPERFLDVSLERGAYVDEPEAMPPKQKLQQRIRGLRTVAAVQRYQRAEAQLDRPECPREEVMAALNRRRAELEGGHVDVRENGASGTQGNRSDATDQAAARTDGGVQGRSDADGGGD
ncbi:hypothetical protein [Haloglomus litoreum]|uniref:hypothetical protein n=1 Tax=Haloglomus litoreum TaxID=3034026 RepID=UPI0023E7B07F|nr:hypothetical protein [Haloglomus sp. DT116]